MSHRADPFRGSVGRRVFCLAVVMAGAGCATGGAALTPVDRAHPKSCRADADCRLVYNVLYRGFCDAGCFNERARPDESCAEASGLQAFPPGLSCACDAGVCSLRKR